MCRKISVISVLDPLRGEFHLEEMLSGYFEQTADPRDFELLLLSTTRACHDLVQASLQTVASSKPAGLDVRSVYCGETASRAKAVNAGMKVCQGELIYIVADDFLLPSEAIGATLNFHRLHPDERMVAVGAGIVPSHLRSEFVDWLESSGSLFGVPFHSEMMAVPEDFFYLGNVSFKRSLVEKAGAFNECFPFHAWDDWEMGLRLVRLGMKSVFLPDTMAVHYHRLGLKERCETVRVAGQSARIFQRENPDFAGPWCAFTQRSMRAEWLRAAFFGVVHRLTRGKRWKAEYFRAVTQLEFQRGYFSTV